MRTTAGVVLSLGVAVTALLVGACAPRASEPARPPSEIPASTVSTATTFTSSTTSATPTVTPTAPTVTPTAPTVTPTAPTASTTSMRIVAPETTRRPTVRIAMVGDVMLGRGLSRIVRSDPRSIFEDVRFVLSNVDIAGANMESPLTNRRHIALNPYALEASPETARLLATAGFDVLSVANNHAGDAGRASVVDSVEAIDDAGMRAVGGGVNLSEAVRPVIVDVRGLRVGFLAFDATGAGTPARQDRAGIAPWNDETVRAAVTGLRPSVDLLVVAVHGGVEYRTRTDPYMAALAEDLHGWGVDVVWGSGPHVVQPVFVIDGARPTVVATSLGNFLFDQGDSATKVGAILEILADAGGVVAYRVATVQHRDRRVHFERWDDPDGEAVMLGTEWWSLGRDFEPGEPGEARDPKRFRRAVTCDGRLAVGYGSDEMEARVTSGARRWRGIGFLIPPTVDREVALGCADVDGDGRTDPILVP